MRFIPFINSLQITEPPVPPARTLRGRAATDAPAKSTDHQTGPPPPRRAMSPPLPPRRNNNNNNASNYATLRSAMSPPLPARGNNVGTKSEGIEARAMSPGRDNGERPGRPSRRPMSPTKGSQNMTYPNTYKKQDISTGHISLAIKTEPDPQVMQETVKKMPPGAPPRPPRQVQS